MTLNSVELGETDIAEDGLIRLELPEPVIRKLDHGQLNLRPIVIPCGPTSPCYPRGHILSRIRIEDP